MLSVSRPCPVHAEHQYYAPGEDQTFDVDVDDMYPRRAQFISLDPHADLASALMDFDVDMAAVAFDGGRVWGLPRAIEAIATRTFRVRPQIMEHARNLSRIRKYRKRGFEPKFLCLFCRDGAHDGQCIEGEGSLVGKYFFKTVRGPSSVCETPWKGRVEREVAPGKYVVSFQRDGSEHTMSESALAKVRWSCPHDVVSLEPPPPQTQRGERRESRDIDEKFHQFRLSDTGRPAGGTMGSAEVELAINEANAQKVRACCNRFSEEEFNLDEWPRGSTRFQFPRTRFIWEVPVSTNQENLRKDKPSDQLSGNAMFYSHVCFERTKGDAVQFFANLYQWPDAMKTAVAALPPCVLGACRMCRVTYFIHAFPELKFGDAKVRRNTYYCFP